MNYKKSVSSALVLLVLVLMTPTVERAQGTYKPGDAVMASPSSLKDDKYYQPCTFVRYESGSIVVDCGGTEYLVSSAYVRPGKAAANTPAPEKPARQTVAMAKKDGEFSVGDRVLVTVSGLKREDSYQPCTVISELKDNAYGVRCDARGAYPITEYAVRPEWVKYWPNATPEPRLPDCPFTKDYAKVSHSAPASAALFKSVIFHRQQSNSDFYDFGITFLDFKMGRTYKNVFSVSTGKSVYNAPLGATVYSVKTKELMCRKSLKITQRWIHEVEYGCYKNNFNEWECAGYPTKLEQTSFPNK